MTKEHSLKIKKSRETTSIKRQSQICKTYELKFDKSHLSKEKTKWLNQLFLESKWLYNHILSSENIINFDTKIKKVFILNKDKNLEERTISNLSAQIKQSIKNKIITSMKSLKSSKNKGIKIGRLKFKSAVNSIYLPSSIQSYKLKSNGYVKLENFKKSFKVLGLNQIPDKADFANANLIRRNNNYYLKITVFIDKDTLKKVKTNRVIGLDFGIKDNITDSDGVKISFSFPETKRIKKCSRKLSRTKKGSKNREKRKLELAKSYEFLRNRKKDTKNQYISYLKKEYDIICIQDEQISNWYKSGMKGFGRKIHHSIIGGIISELKKYSETVIIDKFFPSTQLCPSCGKKNKHSLKGRVYNCSCGYTMDRDTHAARNILIQGLKQISGVHTNTILVEETLDKLLSTYDKNLQIPVKQEALFLGRT